MIVRLNCRYSHQHVTVLHRARAYVDLFYVGKHKTRPVDLLADRRDDVAHLELTGCHFRQHRRKERVVVTAEKNDFSFVWTQSPLQLSSDGNARESSADDHDDRHANRLK